MTTLIATVSERFKRNMVALLVNKSRLEFNSRYAII